MQRFKLLRVQDLSPNSYFRVLLILVFFLISCGEDRPATVMSTESFKPLLKEMLIAESGVEALPLSYTEKKEAREQRYRLIFQNASISADEFFTSFEYYRMQPEIMDSMYTSILDELNETLMQQRMTISPGLEASLPNRP
jgi:hypothetical protein